MGVENFIIIILHKSVNGPVIIDKGGNRLACIRFKGD